MRHASDSELLGRWRAGDNDAGGALIKRHFTALHRFFANKARGDEEDLIQLTFAACVEARDAFRGEASFRTFLFKLARHELFDHYRRVHRRRDIDFVTTSVRDLGTSPSQTLLKREQSDLLERALQHIPLDQQIALELAYWEELSAPQIAEVLGIPENTVYSRLRRAKDHLREALARLSDGEAQHGEALRLLTGGRED